MELMSGRYSTDVAGFLLATDRVATALESLGHAVSGALVALSDVPRVEIDPSALSAAAESLRNHANTATDSADQVMTTWNTLPASYEAPESGELLARMSVCPRAADDFAQTMRRVAAIMAQLADQLAP